MMIPTTSGDSAAESDPTTMTKTRRTAAGQSTRTTATVSGIAPRTLTTTMKRKSLLPTARMWTRRKTKRPTSLAAARFEGVAVVHEDRQIASAKRL